MRILLTGGSSFTGLWFAQALAKAGHKIVAPLPRAQGDYDGLRKRRVEALAQAAEIVWQAPFGGDAFMALAAAGPWDRLCHHGAKVGDYRSPDFDVAGTLAENTRNLPAILRVMKDQGLSAIILTGSVFEHNEGSGSAPLRAFSPYGLSKGLTSEAVRFWCGQAGVPLTKFVIPNPFGPFEEPRFCNYLLQCWTSGKMAAVKTPAYVRDNIPVSLLALAYADAVETAGAADFTRIGPSFYVETQGAFAERFAKEIGARLGIDCPLDLMQQTDFPEPRIRINTDVPDAARLGWDEAADWNELADYYRTQFGVARERIRAAG